MCMSFTVILFYQQIVLLVGILTLILSTYSTIQNAERATELRNEPLNIKETTLLPTLIPLQNIGKHSIRILNRSNL